MIRFNYIDEPLANVLVRILERGIAQNLRTPFTVFAGVICVLLGWSLMERKALDEALVETQRAHQRLDESRSTLAQVRIWHRDFDRVLSLDRRLRLLRDSGPVVASTIADIANRLPARSWLRSLTMSDSTMELDGHAGGFDVLAGVLDRIGSSREAAGVALLRATRDEGRPYPAGVSFEIRAQLR